MKELETYEVIVHISDKEKAEWMKVKWRAFGAIGKLHNIVKYIRISTKRRAGFKTLLQDLEKHYVKVPMICSHNGRKQEIVIESICTVASKLH